MRATLVIVLVLAALALVWVFGLTLNLFAGFGFIVLAITADVVRNGGKRQTPHPAAQGGDVPAAALGVERSYERHHEPRRAA